MNTTADLRQALARHADLQDYELSGRAASVHDRVRVVRRRRRAALTGAAAALVVGGLGLTVLPASDDEAGLADRRFAGLTAPATMSALGYTYEFERLVGGEGKVEIDLPAMDEPYLVTWAGEGSEAVRVIDPTPDLSLDGGLGAPFNSGSDFLDYVVGNGDGLVSDEIEVHGPNRVAVAIYRLAERPAGVTGAGITFREDRAGDRLLGAVIGEKGQTELFVDVVIPAGEVSEEAFCIDAPEGYIVRSTLGGGGEFTSGCADVPHFDGRGDSWTSHDLTDGEGKALMPGDRVTGRIWVVREGAPAGAPPAEGLPGVRLALAYYAKAPAVAEVAGWLQPELLEFGGHTYRHVEVVESEAGRASYSLTRRVADRPLLVVAAARTDDENVSFRVLVDGITRTSYTSAGGAFESEVGPLREGQHVIEVRRKGASPTDVVGFAVYERIS